MADLISTLNSVSPELAAMIAAKPWLLVLIIAGVIFKLVFYPMGLYYTGKTRKPVWFTALFVCFLFLNDFGLVPLVYILVNKRLESNKANTKIPASKNKGRNQEKNKEKKK